MRTEKGFLFRLFPGLGSLPPKQEEKNRRVFINVLLKTFSKIRSIFVEGYD